MTEQEWLGCNDPQRMLEFLRGGGLMPDTWEVGDRKKWLLTCASLYRLQPDDEETNQFIEQTERLVERQGNYQQWWVIARRFSGLPVLVNGDTGDAVLLRDIFGNPFRPVVVNRACLTPAVVELARTIYEDRRFDRLKVLADALGEAGCDNADILNHCRQPGEHVRAAGSWISCSERGRS